MIASVRGEVLEVALDHVVIEAGGVGYRVNATPSTLATLRQGSEALLITAMIVREDSQTLYGFPDGETRDLFLTLLSVSGVGPRLAVATLAVHDAAALRQALADGDVAALTRVPGIGKRGAERMVLELRDKIGAVAGTTPAPVINGRSVRGPVVEAPAGDVPATAPILSRSSRTIRSAPRLPMPGTRVSAATSPSANAWRSAEASCTASVAIASRGPTPETDSSVRKRSLLSPSTNP